MTDLRCCDFDHFLRAMADETRQHILALLREREWSVTELTEQFALTQPTISHHLALLRRAHLVIARREGRQTFYRANPACIVECCQEILTRFKLSEAAR